jgi:hypothetical protein
VGYSELSLVKFRKRVGYAKPLYRVPEYSTSSATSGIASPRIIQAAVDRRTADLVYEELLNFVQNHSPGAVQKGQDKIFYFDTQLERKTPEL